MQKSNFLKSVGRRITQARADTGVSYTPPSQYKNPTNFVWDAQDLTWTEDGIILTLTFSVSATAASGDYSVTLEYDPYDVFDGEGDPIGFEVFNATIEVR